MSDIQKIRLQIIHGNDEEWSGALSALKPKVGELCVNYSSSMLKIGDGSKTFSELPVLAGINYYSQVGNWVNKGDAFEYNAAHSSGDDAYKLCIALPMGTTADRIAWGDHTHKQIKIDDGLILQGNTIDRFPTAMALEFQKKSGEYQGISTILVNAHYGFNLQITNGSGDEQTTTNWVLASSDQDKPSDFPTPDFHIATMEEVFDMPQIKFCSVNAIIPGDTTYDKTQIPYKLTFKVVKGCLQEGDRVELCVTSLSTENATGSKKRKRYRMRRKWKYDLTIDHINSANKGLPLSIEMAYADFENCRFAGKATLINDGTIKYYRYPVYLRIRRSTNSGNDAIFSNIIPLQIHYNSKTGVWALR